MGGANWRDLFAQCDDDGSGELDEEEFLECVRHFCGKGSGATALSESEIKVLFSTVDVDGSGAHARVQYGRPSPRPAPPPCSALRRRSQPPPLSCAGGISAEEFEQFLSGKSGRVGAAAAGRSAARGQGKPATGAGPEGGSALAPAGGGAECAGQACRGGRGAPAVSWADESSEHAQQLVRSEEISPRSTRDKDDGYAYSGTWGGPAECGTARQSDLPWQSSEEEPPQPPPQQEPGRYSDIESCAAHKTTTAFVEPPCLAKCPCGPSAECLSRAAPDCG